MKHMTFMTQILGGLAIAAAVVACGSDDNDGTPATGGAASGGAATGGTTSGGTSAGGTTTGGTSAGGTSSGGAATGGEAGGTGEPTAECVEYCEEWDEHCDGELGGNLDYDDNDDCLETCAGFDHSGMDGDDSGNTVQCRITHVGLAATDNVSHCNHAAATPMGGCN